MMEFFKKTTHIDFMGHRNITSSFSLVLCFVAIVCLFVFKLNFGLEFTGGTQVELRFEDPQQPELVKQELEKNGFPDVRVQQYGSVRDILIRIANLKVVDEDKISDKLSQVFIDAAQPVEVRRVEYVGSEVGDKLAEQGTLAVLVAILATMIYIALRFEYRFALGAAVALCHDVVLVLGIFALFQVEFDLATLAAVLAVLGYSLNDTIVVFDRVRENFRRMRQGSTQQIINVSINQTLSRTLMTSWLTLLVVVALLIFGGESLYGFSLALCIGVVVGTYSSIFVASAFSLVLGLSRADLLPKPKAELDGMP